MILSKYFYHYRALHLATFSSKIKINIIHQLDIHNTNNLRINKQIVHVEV